MTSAQPRVAGEGVTDMGMAMVYSGVVRLVDAR
jgi:hypothetical protein